MQISTTFCGRRLKSMLLTASISVFVEIANLFIDKIVAGQMIGEKGLAAIALMTPLFSVVFFVGVVIAVGSFVSYSYEIGKVNKERASCFFSQGVILSIIAGIILSLFFGVMKDYLFTLFDVSLDLIKLTNDFYVWFIALAFFIPSNNLLQEMVYVDGDVHICILSCISLTCVNVIMSIILSKYLGMQGIAIGSLIAIIVSDLILLVHFLKKTNTLKFKWHLKLRDCIQVIHLSLAESSDYLFFAAFSSTLTHFVILKIGETHLPILSMMFEVWEFGIIFTGIWLAAEPLINIYRGEENAFCIKRLMKFVNWMVLKEGLFVTFGLLLFAPLIVRLFHFSSVELIENAILAIRIASIGMITLAFVKVYVGYYVHEWPGCAVILVAISSFVIPTISCISFGYAFGINGVWIGLGISPIIAFIICLFVISLRYGWKNVPLILSSQLENTHRYVSDMQLTPENIMQLRNQTEQILLKENVCSNTRMKIMLFIEEIGMIFYDRCKGRKIYAEHILHIEHNNVTCIIKDEGPFMDLTESDVQIGDLRMYLVNSLMGNHHDKTYLLTNRYNRHVFKFPR